MPVNRHFGDHAACASDELDEFDVERESLDPFEKKQTLQDVADAFDRLVKDHPCAIVVDASVPPDEVTARIYAALDGIVGK